MMMSSASSQQLSSDSTVIVPVKSLRKALEMKIYYNSCRDELGVARDSIRIQDSIIFNQYATIDNLVQQTEVFKANEQNYETTIEYKDEIIKIKEEEITKLKATVRGACAAIVLTTVSFILILL